MLDGRQAHGLREAQGFDGAELERPLLGEEAAHFHRHFLEHVGGHVEQVPESIRARHVRHVGLVFETFLGLLKRGGQVEDRPPVLDGDDAPGGEAAAVACAVDLVNDRLGHVAAAQEIRVQRVGDPSVHGVLRGRQRLAQHLSPENLGAPDVAAVAAEDIVFDTLELQQRDQVFEYGVHCRAVAVANRRCGHHRPPRRYR